MSTNSLREAAQQALEAMEKATRFMSDADYRKLNEAITALRAALAEPVQEPEPAGWFEGPFGEFRANPLHRIAWPAQTVAWSIPLYLAPPQRPAEPVQEPASDFERGFQRGWQRAMRDRDRDALMRAKVEDELAATVARSAEPVPIIESEITADKREPVQEPIGSDWEPCVKLPVTVHVRAQHPGETHVSTREGITPVKPDDLIMRGVSGEEYPIGRDIFERTYQRGEAPPQRKPLTEEEIYLGTNQIDRGERGWAIKFARAIERAHGVGDE